MSEELNQQDESANLKARLDLMGVSYHPSIGLEKLREKVAAAIAGTPQEQTPQGGAPAAAPAVETEGMLRKRLKNEALALMRIRLACMNPAKKDWEGEVITVGNSLVGTVSKYIPFNADEGWHVPKIMYEMLVARQCQVFVPSKTKNGITKRESKLIREFAIEVLPMLTEEELHDLAQRQAMSQSVG